jgi:hypothetical protein
MYERDENKGADPALVAELAARLVVQRKVSVRYSVGRFDQRLMVLVKRAIPAWVFERMMKVVYAIK